MLIKFQNAFKSYLKKMEDQRKKITFRYAGIDFFIDICLDETKADIDQSKTLSVREAVYLAFALSLDSLVTGFGIGLTQVNHAVVLSFSLVLHLVALLLGSLIGQKLAKRSSINISWLSGAILIVLAFIRIF